MAGPGSIAYDASSIVRDISRIAQREPLDLESASRSFPQSTTDGEVAAGVGRSDRRLVQGLDRRSSPLVVRAGGIVVLEMRQVATDDQ